MGVDAGGAFACVDNGAEVTVGDELVVLGTCLGAKTVVAGAGIVVRVGAEAEAEVEAEAGARAGAEAGARAGAAAAGAARSALGDALSAVMGLCASASSACFLKKKKK